MIGLGTIINCGSVLAGASVGMLLKNGLSKRFEDTIMQGIGLCTMFIGIGGALSGLLTLENGQLSTQHTMLLILSLALGALIGEALNIEKHLEDFGIFCQDRLKSQGDSHFGRGLRQLFAAYLHRRNGHCRLASGRPFGRRLAAHREGHHRRHRGGRVRGLARQGRILSILPLGVYQGGLTLLARFIRPWMTDELIAQMSCVGSVLIFAVSLNMIRKDKIKVGNLLPAVFLPVVFYLLSRFFPVFATL